MREMAKKMKQEDKRERKEARQNPQADETPSAPAPVDGTPPPQNP